MIWSIALVLVLAFGVFLDLVSLFLALRKNRTIGPGPSGIPLLPWLAYVVFVLSLHTYLLAKAIALMLLTLFHAAVHALIPFIDREWFNGRTVLHRAALLGNLQLLEFGIRKGIDLNVRDNIGWTPLLVASAGRHLNIMRSLLLEGAEVCGADYWGRTPLHFAASDGYREGVELLLAYGGDPTARTTSGNTPVSLAKSHGHADVLSLLESR